MTKPVVRIYVVVIHERCVTVDDILFWSDGGHCPYSAR
jgi:hypothetical protein